jgi:hypothetical protein
VTTRADTTADDLRRTRLRERIATDLHAVRPLRPPWARALVLAPLALLLLAMLPLVVFPVRTDRLPVVVSWGASVLQVGLGLVLAALACRQVVPGRWASTRTAVAWLTLGVAGVCAVMAVTWNLSPVRLPDSVWETATLGCLKQSFLDGLPLLAVALVLVGRGLPARPAGVGALAGLSAGIFADAAWRMVCVVNGPSHILLGHLGAVLLLSLTGSVLLSLWCHLRSGSDWELQ